MGTWDPTEFFEVTNCYWVFYGELAIKGAGSYLLSTLQINPGRVQLLS
jgi:hypothetical protein